jgi:hypothetical protein
VADADHYDIIVAKSDSLGNLIWIRNYGGFRMDIGYKIIETYDSKLLVSGKTSSLLSANYTQQWLIVKLDTNGNIMWQKDFGHPEYRDFSPIGLIETSDTSYIVTGSLAIEMPDASERLRGRILKTDRNGNIVWDRLYGYKTPYTYASIIKEKNNGDLICIFNDGPTAENGYAGIYNPFILELSSKGDIKWFRKYLFNNKEDVFISVLNSFDFTPDGGYIFAGYGTDTDSVPSQRSWVIKTDSHGFDGTFWQGDSTLGVSMVNDTVCYSDSVLVHFHITGKSAPYSLLLSNGNSSDSIFYSPYFEPYAFDSLYIYPTDSNLWHSFSATVTDPWGNTVTENFSVFVDGCGTNIDELYGDSIIFNIYPNPSDGNFYAEVSCQRGSQGLTQSQTLTGKRGVEIKISGLNGHHKTTIPVVSEKTLINTTGWAKGTYVCNLIINGKVVRSEKLVLK